MYTRKHKIEIDLEYHYHHKMMMIRVDRKVYANGLLIHSDRLTNRGFMLDNSILRKMELWAIDRLPHDLERGKNRLSNRRNLLGLFQQIRRKLFAE